jgi:ubiquitin C-terminal hydrolase
MYMNYDYKSYASKKFYNKKGLSNCKNLGNTCYLNSTLSVLGNCLGLTHYFVSSEFTKIMDDVSMSKREYVFLNQYINVLIGLYTKNQTIAPRTLYNNLSVFLPGIKRGYQNDSYECMVGILNLLHISLSKKIDFGPPDTKIHKHVLESRKELYKNFKDGYSIINELFFGQYIQKVKCTECKTLSFTYQQFMGINLPIIKIEGIIPSIYDLMNAYFKSQVVNKPCEKCSKNTDHSLNFRIIKLPKYLIITFKRFDNKLNKIVTTVPFSSCLEMSDYTSLLDSSVEYSLSSVVNHSGNFSGGHYYNFNRTFNGEWVCVNDDKTTKIQNLDVCTNNAYILIYELDEF